MDLVLGRFADAFIEDLSDADLADFEALLDVPDQDLFGWICDRPNVAANYDTGLFRMIVEFHTGKRTSL